MERPDAPRGPGDAGRKWLIEFGPYLTIGIQLAASVVVFFFVGRWFDGVLGTSPWLMILGLFVGTVGGFISFFRSAVRMGKKENDREHSQRDGGSGEDR